jgi:DNA-binding transcriptional MerR regulator
MEDMSGTILEQQDRPMSLKHAAELFGIGVDTLRAERRRGRLQTYRIGREIRTTINDIKHMVELCREEPKAHAFTVTRRGASTASETATYSLDLAQQALQNLRSISRTTSGGSTGRKLARGR